MSQSPNWVFVVQHRDYPLEEVDRAYAFADPDETWWQEVIARYPAKVEPVRRVFTSRTDAETLLADLEQTARASCNLRPLYSGYRRGLDGLLGLTEFDLPVFLDWLADHDIPPPPKGEWIDFEVWERWLIALTRTQITYLFQGLHNLAFYELIEVELVVGDYLPQQWEEWEHDPRRRPTPPDAAPTVHPQQPGLPWPDDGVPF